MVHSDSLRQFRASRLPPRRMTPDALHNFPPGRAPMGRRVCHRCDAPPRCVIHVTLPAEPRRRSTGPSYDRHWLSVSSAHKLALSWGLCRGVSPGRARRGGKTRRGAEVSRRRAADRSRSPTVPPAVASQLRECKATRPLRKAAQRYASTSNLMNPTSLQGVWYRQNRAHETRLE